MIEETRDMAFVKDCLTHPYVWRNAMDDAFRDVNPGLFFPPLSDCIVYLRAGDDGVFVGRRINAITYDVHIALLPSARGRAKAICEEAIKFFFARSTDPVRLIASIPENRPLVIRLAKAIGMEFIGVNRKSFLKDGVLLDQHLYGISKEDVCQQD